MDALIKNLHELVGEFDDEFEAEFDQWTTTDQQNNGQT